MNTIDEFEHVFNDLFVIVFKLKFAKLDICLQRNTTLGIGIELRLKAAYERKYLALKLVCGFFFDLSTNDGAVIVYFLGTFFAIQSCASKIADTKITSFFLFDARAFRELF